MKKVIINYENTAKNLLKKMYEFSVNKYELREIIGLKTCFKINKLISGKAIPSLKELIMLCDFFDIKANELIDYFILGK